MYLKILICLILLFLFPTASFAQTNDVTSKIENLGNPTKSKWPDTNTSCRYARNVWDMQSFGNKVYLGNGNSANSGPCANAGPVPVISFSPTSNSFTNEFTVDEEQIDLFRIINGQLATPGHDPKSGNSISWYRLESGNWVRHSSPIDTMHTNDIYYFQNKLFLSAAYPTALISLDDGLSWPETAPGVVGGRTLFEFKGKMYITTAMTTATLNPPNLYEYLGANSFRTILAPSGQRLYQVVFPGQPFTLDVTKPAVLYHPLEFNQKLVYIGATFVNDMQTDPFGLYFLSDISASGVSGVQAISLPGNAKPWDILIRADGKITALGSIQNGSRFWVTVSSSSDLTNWTEEFRFDSPTFARSFEQLDGDWYFGLGTDTTTLSTSTGDILRYSSVRPSPSTSSVKLGDVDNDGDVDIFDYNFLLTDFGKTGLFPADFDKNGKVDIFDYNILLTNFKK